MVFLFFPCENSLARQNDVEDEKEKELELTPNTSARSEKNDSAKNLLLDSKTNIIQPLNLRFRAAFLFTTYAQNGADPAVGKNQDLIEWLENTLKMFESCQSLNSFFDCFEEDLNSFPDLQLLAKDLKTQSEALLQGIDVIQHLDKLKQDIGDNLSHEVSSIFSIRQRKNAQKLRTENEKKVRAEETYHKLRKEIGVSSSDSRKEMATAAWQYMLHNMPLLFNNISIVNKYYPHWGRSHNSESEWTKRLISELKIPASPYSNLPAIFCVITTVFII